MRGEVSHCPFECRGAHESATPTNFVSGFIFSSFFKVLGREKSLCLVLVHAAFMSNREVAHAVHTRRVSSVKPGRRKKTSVVKEGRVRARVSDPLIWFVLNWYTPMPTTTVVARSVHMSKGPRAGNLRLWT